MKEDNFLDSVKLSEEYVKKVALSFLPRHRRGDPFIRGPLPLDWVEIVFTLSFSAVKLAFALWFKAGCHRDRIKPATVVMSAGILERFGLKSRTAVSRATAELEAAGLIHTKKRIGRRPEITILPSPVPVKRISSEEESEETLKERGAL